jgi:hypothetical protein
VPPDTDHVQICRSALALTTSIGQDARVSDERSVYLLWHGDDLDEGPDAKLLGVYSSEDAARDRVQRASSLPGFVDHPDAFEIVRYEIDHDGWTTGYVEDPNE